MVKSSFNDEYEPFESAECSRHGTYIHAWRKRGAEDFCGIFYSRGCPECIREREERASLGRAAIPLRFANKSIDSFEETEQTSAVANYVRRYIETLDDRIAKGTSIIFCGRPGTGKTHLACAILNVARARGRKVLFTTAYGLIRSVRDTWRNDSEKTERQVVDALVNLDVLTIDEVGVQACSDNERNILFDVINARYEAVRPTILLSNLTLSGVSDVLGERCIDRFKENGGRCFAFTWESHRA